jgi:transposase
MKIEETLGIDVSKLVIDVTLYTSKKHSQFKNSKKGFIDFEKWLTKTAEFKLEQIFICFEHTGIYSIALTEFLSKCNLNYSVVSAIKIKRSMGLTRGKNDKIDSFRIAEYAYLRRESIQTYKLPSKNILKLQKTLSLREQLVKHRASYKATLKEYKSTLTISDFKEVITTMEQCVGLLNRKINKIDNEISKIIDADIQMKKIYQLITSIKGIGKILASNLMVTTKCFTAFEDGRKYACYAGVAPFQNQSGSSIRGRSQVSNLANKKMKSLLNMAAISAIQNDPELKLYYQNRIENGKNKMSTINIVRNKIIHRVFAVVKRGTPFVNLKKY